MTEQEYRALPIESFSSIKHILESPLVFKHYKERPFKGSTATLLGTAIHHYLQGNQHFIAFNELSRTKKNEEAHKLQEELLRNVAGDDGIIVPVSFKAKLDMIMKNYVENTKAVEFLSKCKFEEPFLFRINDVDLKGKIDGVADDYIVEIKSSSQATNAQEFKQEALDRDYDMQAYMYTVAAQKLHHYFIVVNTVDPFKVSIYRSSYEFIASGHEKAMLATERYKKYILKGEPWDERETIEEI